MYNLPAPVIDREDFKRRREATGLTQVQASEALGMTREAVSRIETGAVALATRTRVQAAVTFAWIMQYGISAADVPLPARPGRHAVVKPDKLIPGALYAIYRLLDGTSVTRDELEAMPLGTRLEFIEAKGRRPDPARDTWRPAVRKYPNQTCMPADIADPFASMAPIPTQARKLTDEEYTALQAIINQGGE